MSKYDEIILPVQNVPETEENRVAAVLETAWAFRRKNPYVQYDNRSLNKISGFYGNRTAEGMNNTPELAGPQRNTYLVCSFYTYGVAYHAFDCRLVETSAHCSAVKLGRAEEESLLPYVLWHYEADDTEEHTREGMEEFRRTVRPGDILSYERKANPVGHAVVWAGDCNGDGEDDILNVDGRPFNYEKLIDFREPDGAVAINAPGGKRPTGWSYFLDEAAYDYFPKLKKVTIYRLPDVKYAKSIPISERAKTRILFPGLVIFFEAEDGVFGCVPKGGEYTYTLKIQNHSDKDHKGILVQLPVPECAEIVRVCGEKAENGIVKRTVDVPAGGETVITYTVKATGNVGDVIKTGTGYVHAIPLPALNTAIVSKKDDAAAVRAAAEAACGESGEAFLAAYLKARGFSVPAPTVAGLLSRLYVPETLEACRVFRPKTEACIRAEGSTWGKMRIPDFFGGQNVITEVSSLRVKEQRAEDLQAGDLLLWQEKEDTAPMAAVHDGERFLLAADGALTPMTQEDLDKFLVYDFFIALRPTQAV